jgi:hypothetical protein
MIPQIDSYAYAKSIMAQFRTSRLFDVIFVLLLGLFVWWAALHRVAISDWMFFWHYQPTPQTIRIADQAGLSPAGRRLLYRTDPQFVSQTTVVAHCDIERLGCLDEHGQVFILDAPGQSDQATVTAAHEMLHLAYRRLSAAQKAELAPLIDQAIDLNTSPVLQDELRDQTNPEDRRDEAHSLLGTEYSRLPPALEEYYTTYFTDRSKVVAAETATDQP